MKPILERSQGCTFPIQLSKDLIDQLIHMTYYKKLENKDRVALSFLRSNEQLLILNRQHTILSRAGIEYRTMI